MEANILLKGEKKQTVYSGRKIKNLGVLSSKLKRRNNNWDKTKGSE